MPDKDEPKQETHSEQATGVTKETVAHTHSHTEEDIVSQEDVVEPVPQPDDGMDSVLADPDQVHEAPGAEGETKERETRRGAKD